MANNTSQHILNTSANLLGFCLFVITSLKLSNRSEGLMIDGFTSVVALLLTLSCFFSFFSIKTRNQVKEQRFEAFRNFILKERLTLSAHVIKQINLNDKRK